MSASLERRYRAALDWYPTAWRAENGEAMLGTLLDEAEATGREKPRLADLANLALHGLRAQLVRLSLVVPARLRDRVSAITLATGFAFALVMFVGAEWAPWSERGPWNGWIADWRPLGDVPGFGPFASAAAVLYVMWIAAFLLALAGLPRFASAMLLFTLPASAVIVDLGARTETMRFVRLAPEASVLILLGMLALVASIGLATRQGQRGPGAIWMTVAAAGALVAVAVHELPNLGSTLAANSGWALENRLHPRWQWASLIDPAYFLAILVGIAVVLVLRARYEWALTFGLAAIPWALAFIAIGLGGGGFASAVASTLLAAIAAVAVAYGVVRKRGYRIVLQRHEQAQAATSAPLSS